MATIAMLTNEESVSLFPKTGSRDCEINPGIAITRGPKSVFTHRGVQCICGTSCQTAYASEMNQIQDCSAAVLCKTVLPFGQYYQDNDD